MRGFYALAGPDGEPVGPRTPGTITTTTAPDGGVLSSYAAEGGPLVADVPDAALVPDPDGLVPPGARFGFWVDGVLVWTSPTYQVEGDGTVTLYTAPT